MEQRNYILKGTAFNSFLKIVPTIIREVCPLLGKCKDASTLIQCFSLEHILSFLCIYTYVDTDMDTDVDVDRCMYMFQTENRLGSEFHKAQYFIIKYLHL